MNFILAVLKIIYLTIRHIVLLFVPKVFRVKSIEREIVLITGGGGGVGKALAVRFSKQGAFVVLWDVSANGLNDAYEAVRGVGGQCKTYLCDITKREEVYATAKLVREEVGIVTILVNNAGIVSCKTFLEIPDQNILKTMDVNCNSQFWTCKAFLPDMVKANHGHIVTISSIAGLTGTDRLSDYCASKFANVGYHESLKYELLNQGMTGIHTTLVCPFYINTGLFAGVKTPSLLPILKVDKVADSILIAVLTNSELLLLPKIAHILFFFKGCLPTKAFSVIVNDLLCMSEALTHFVGHNKSSDNNQNTKHQAVKLEEVVTKL